MPALTQPYRKYCRASCAEAPSCEIGRSNRRIQHHATPGEPRLVIQDVVFVDGAPLVVAAHQLPQRLPKAAERNGIHADRPARLVRMTIGGAARREPVRQRRRDGPPHSRALPGATSQTPPTTPTASSCRWATDCGM